MLNYKTGEMTRMGQSGRFIMAFNPLDIDKIEDAHINMGMMFLLMKKISSSYKPPTKNDFLQSGEKIDCSCFCLFNKHTTIVYHAGFRVNTYFYNKQENRFDLKYHNIKTPKKKGIISFNSSVIDLYDKNLKIYLRRKIQNQTDLDQFYQRYTGSALTDFFRTLLFGGVMLIPEQEG